MGAGSPVTSGAGEARSRPPGRVEVGVDQVTAYRLGAHHLDRRLGPGNALVAAGACALQDSPPGSAAIALHARVTDVDPDLIRDAVEDRSLFL